MTFDEVLDQVRELLQRRGRVTYQSLRLRYQLDDGLLAAVTDELIKAEHVATKEGGDVLVWVGKAGAREARSEEREGTGQKSGVAARSTLSAPHPVSHVPRAEAERRQLTVMFCDLVGSTALSVRLDPEELREVVRGYQETCTKVIRRYDGHIAQHLGDGLLVYFGYPLAHEDDAARAVRAGLEIIAVIRGEVTGGGGQLKRAPLQVRIGIHTGLVVIGEIGSGEKREILALGETPTIAARVQGHAAPDELLVSTTTFRLIRGLFDIEERGPQELKGISTLMALYRVVQKSVARSRFEVAVQTGLTPLVGRAEELALLQRRWEQAEAGNGRGGTAERRARDWQIPPRAGIQRAHQRRRSHPY